MPVKIGSTLSHYQIIEKLGEGGMGVVYLANDTKLNRQVAVKLLPSGITSDQADRARFLREAQAAAAINHPHVCVIHDIQEQDDLQFIIMEYVREPYIPEEIAQLRPREAMMITKRVIGFESEFDIAQNDIEYEMVTCVRAIAGDEVALDQALAYIHHREGLRAKGGAERNAQVVQRTVEELKTFNANQRGGLWARVGSFVKGTKTVDTSNPFNK